MRKSELPQGQVPGADDDEDVRGLPDAHGDKKGPQRPPPRGQPASPTLCSWMGNLRPERMAGPCPRARGTVAGAGLGRDATDPPPRVPAACPRPPQAPASPSPGSILSERGDGGSWAISLAVSPSLGPAQGREQRDQSKGSEGGSWPHTRPAHLPRAVAPNGPRLIRLAGTRVPKPKLAPRSSTVEAIPAGGSRPEREAGGGGPFPSPVRKRGVGIHTAGGAHGRTHVCLLVSSFKSGRAKYVPK